MIGGQEQVAGGGWRQTGQRGSKVECPGRGACAMGRSVMRIVPALMDFVVIKLRPRFGRVVWMREVFRRVVSMEEGREREGGGPAAALLAFFEGCGIVL